MKRWSLAVAVGCLLALPACSPTLDWRELRVTADGRLLFPCRPDQVGRDVVLEQGSVPATMWTCDAGGLTWSLTRFDLDSSERAGRLLLDLRHRLLINLKGSEESALTPEVSGSTASVHARRSSILGVRTDGSPARAEALFVAQGARAYQAVVLGRPSAVQAHSAAIQEFFDSLQWGR